MNREYVVPGVQHRGRAKFGGCCGCCRMFLDRFGSSAYDNDPNTGIHYRRDVGEVKNGWITAKGNCSIDYIDSPLGPRHLKLSGPDCMLVRDMRVDDFTIDYWADYIPGGFTLGAEYDPDDGFILFHPEKEHRFLFNWVDENNFDFISYWDWNLLNDYTIAKVGTRENGSERFFLPPKEGIMINGYTYNFRIPYRKFCYVNDVFFIENSNFAAGGEYPGYAFTYGKPLRSKLCGIGTGPGFVGDWYTNYFVAAKPTTEEQRLSPTFGGQRDLEDCKWCPRPLRGCTNYVAPQYIIAEKFNDGGVSQYTINLSRLTGVGGGQEYNSNGVDDDGNALGFGVTVTIDPDTYSPFGFVIPNPTAGTVRVDEYTTVLFNTYHLLYKLPSIAARDDCDSWDKLRIDPDPDGLIPGSSEPGDGYWELTGVYEL